MSRSMRPGMLLHVQAYPADQEVYYDTGLKRVKEQNSVTSKGLIEIFIGIVQQTSSIFTSSVAANF